MDYAFEARREAYQAHYRRISASRYTGQSAEGKASALKKKQAEKEQQKRILAEQAYVNAQKQLQAIREQDNVILPYRPAPASHAFETERNLKEYFPLDLVVAKPTHKPFPKSAPAVLPSFTKKHSPVAQEDIPVGFEPALSPASDVDKPC